MFCRAFEALRQGQGHVWIARGEKPRSIAEVRRALLSMRGENLDRGWSMKANEVLGSSCISTSRVSLLQFVGTVSVSRSSTVKNMGVNGLSDPNLLLVIRMWMTA
jgi:hypothetical protein